MLTLALNTVISNLLLVFFLLVCVTMVLVVLIQRPQGGGLSGAFGSGGASSGAGQTAFGTKTGDVLTWGTVGVFFLYIVLAIVLNFTAKPRDASGPMAPVVSDPALQENLPDPPPGDSALPPLEDNSVTTPAEAVETVTGAVKDAVTPDPPVVDPALEPWLEPGARPDTDNPAEPTDPASAEQPR